MRIKIHKGFTFIEMLLVLVVFGVLATITMLSANSASISTDASSFINDLNTLRAAALMHRMDHPEAYQGKEKEAEGGMEYYSTWDYYNNTPDSQRNDKPNRHEPTHGQGGYEEMISYHGYHVNFIDRLASYTDNPEYFLRTNVFYYRPGTTVETMHNWYVGADLDNYLGVSDYNYIGGKVSETSIGVKGNTPDEKRVDAFAEKLEEMAQRVNLISDRGASPEKSALFTYRGTNSYEEEDTNGKKISVERHVRLNKPWLFVQ